MIPQASPLKQFLSQKKNFLYRINKTLNSGTYILGREVQKFEKEFAKYIGVKNAISCASGTDALFIALKQFNIGIGDEVILPSHTATATSAAIKMTGAKPVYVDIKPDCYTIDPKKVLMACNKKTKAIIAVHIYGQVCDMEKLMEIGKIKKIKVIEDCAQSAGSMYKNKKAGSFGDVGCFSFFPTKNLGAFGDGGCLVTSNKSLAVKARRFRQYGWDNNRNANNPGINSRLDELQATILRLKLKRLNKDNLVRNQLANFYKINLKIPELLLPKVCKKNFHSFHLFVIQCTRRNKLINHLKKNNIGTAIHYPKPVHCMKGYYSNIKLPETEKISKKILSLPLFPGLKKSDQIKIIKSIKQFYKKN